MEMTQDGVRTRTTRLLEVVDGRWVLVFSIVIFVFAIGSRLIPGPRTIDDSFITFRYASNILAGNGFVYNPGERVLGTTTPLYTILLTTFAAITGGAQAPFPQIALLLNAFADALTCLLLVNLGRRLGSTRAGMAAALVWSVAPFSVTFAIGGLETSVYILLLTAAVYAHLRKKHTLAALLGALSFLTRPDALILLGPLAVDRLWEEIRDWRLEKRGIGERGVGDRLLSLVPSRLEPLRSPIPLIPFSPAILREASVFLIPTLAWLLFATLYFGSPFPHSVAAKSLAYHLPPTAALARLLQHFATPFLEHLTFGLPAIAVGMVLYPFLFIVGAHRALHSATHSWPYLAYPWLYFAVFALANPLIFRWYLTPPLPVYFLMILMGVDTIFSPKRSRLGLSPISRVGFSPISGVGLSPISGVGFSPISRVGLRTISALSNLHSSLVHRPWSIVLGPASLVYRLSSIFLLLPFALSLRDWTLRPDHGLDRPAPGMAWYQLELLYRQAAEILAPELGSVPGEQILAAGDVGVLGFFTGARILDTVGLNSPVSTQYYPLDPALYTINYAVPPDLILDQKPDFIIILEVYGRAGLLKDSRFWKNYELLRQIPTNIYGSKGMVIFKREDLSR